MPCSATFEDHLLGISEENSEKNVATMFICFDMCQGRYFDCPRARMIEILISQVSGSLEVISMLRREIMTAFSTYLYYFSYIYKCNL